MITRALWLTAATTLVFAGIFRLLLWLFSVTVFFLLAPSGAQSNREDLGNAFTFQTTNQTLNIIRGWEHFKIKFSCPVN